MNRAANNTTQTLKTIRKKTENSIKPLQKKIKIPYFNKSLTQNSIYPRAEYNLFNIDSEEISTLDNTTIISLDDEPNNDEALKSSILDKIEQVACKLNTIKLVIKQTAHLLNKLPKLVQKDLNNFKSEVVTDDGCPFSLIDFPVKKINSFNEFNKDIFVDWAFCIYYIKQQYFISQYTKLGLEKTKATKPPLDLKVRVHINEAVVITYEELQYLEQCFLINNSQVSLKKTIDNHIHLIDDLSLKLKELQEKYIDIDRRLEESNSKKQPNCSCCLIF